MSNYLSVVYNKYPEFQDGDGDIVLYQSEL